MSGQRTALALAGGIALGAFEAGVWDALEEAAIRPDWLLGASIGAVTAVLIAGGPPGGARDRLERFWRDLAFEPMPATGFWFGPTPPAGPLRRGVACPAAARPWKRTHRPCPAPCAIWPPTTASA